MKTTIRYVLTLAALLLSSSSFAANYWYNALGPYYASSESDLAQLICNHYNTGPFGGKPFTNCRAGQLTYENSTSRHYLNCRNNANTANNCSSPNYIHYFDAVCPAQLPYEWQDGFCYATEEPPQECPDGQFIEGGQCVHGCQSGASVKQVLPLPDITDKAVDPLLGCNLEIDTSKTPECNFQTFMCNVFYTDTGVYNPDFSYENGNPPDPVPEITPSPEPVTTETVDGPVTETVNNPDGSTTTTETTEITKVNQQGDLVEIIGDSIVLKNQSGEIIEILQQYETNTYTDGTSQVTETVTTIATPNSITETKKNLIDGSTTVTTRTYNRGLTGTTTTTTTKTFDSTGKQTGSATVTTGSVSETDGSGNGGGGEGGDELCGAPGQPICDVRIHEDESDYDISQISDLESQYDQAVEDFHELNTDEILGVADMSWTNADYWISNFLNIPNISSCSGSINTVIFGRPFILDPCEKLAPLREILAWVFSILATFTIIAIIFNRKLI